MDSLSIESFDNLLVKVSEHSAYQLISTSLHAKSHLIGLTHFGYGWVIRICHFSFPFVVGFSLAETTDTDPGLGLELAKANPALLGPHVLALGQLDRGVPFAGHVAENTGHFSSLGSCYKHSISHRHFQNDTPITKKKFAIFLRLFVNVIHRLSTTPAIFGGYVKPTRRLLPKFRVVSHLDSNSTSPDYQSHTSPTPEGLME
jgi:hypothetical protein